MKTSSCKAKSRRLQQLVCKQLLSIGKQYGLKADDIKSTPMGCTGVDVQFSPRARKIFNLAIECKNQEHLNVVKEYLQHCEGHKKDRGKKLLIHTKNHTMPMVTLSLDDFLYYLSVEVYGEQVDRY